MDGGFRLGFPLPPRVMAAVLSAVVAVGLTALVSFHLLAASATAAQDVTHTLNVLDRLETVLSTLKDAETGQRGYLLTDNESYLEPYSSAVSNIGADVQQLRAAVSGNEDQLARVEALEKIVQDKMSELAKTVQLHRDGQAGTALDLVKSDRGKLAMDRARSLVLEMKRAEGDVLAERQEQRRLAAGRAILFDIGSSFVLILLIGVATLAALRTHRLQRLQDWQLAGHAELSLKLQGEHRLEVVGETVLNFVAAYLGARVGKLFVVEGPSEFRGIASYGSAQDDGGSTPAAGLLAQSVKENRPMRIRDVPPGYLTVSSSLGQAAPREILIAPADVEGVVQSVIELGFFRAVRAEDQAFLARVSELLGLAVRTSKERSHLEQLLEETQRQAEELQTQEEELRVSNEELEERGTILQKSQLQLENQQVELEQINSQLEEQMQQIAQQRDALERSQIKLAANAEELARTNRYKSEFLANMSHELRTPLNSTLILAGILADNKAGNLTDEQVKFARTISAAGADLLALINDILDLSKIEARKLDIVSEPVSPRGVIEASMGFFEQTAKQKNLALSLSIEASAPETIRTDPQRLSQILRNLLANAIKFTESGGVSVDVRPLEGERLAIAVKDTGVGIPESQQGLIFEAFRQADGSTHRRFGGTGLGLSISRELAGLLGGELSVQSAAGLGSTFTLTLPFRLQDPELLAAPTSTVTAPLPASPAPAAASESEDSAEFRSVITDDRRTLTEGSRRVLVIEDDARFADILLDVAHQRGFQCLIASTGHEGLACATRYQPDAILLDMHLPDQSGLSILGKLKNNPKTRHIPIHVLSVADFSREARERGAVGYALKPVTSAQLVAAFETLQERFSNRLRRVLVVEDDSTQRESIRHLLSSSSVEIMESSTGRGALERLRETTFDCMVMDLSLPDISGYELLEQMAENEQVAFPPVIVYTGRSLSRNEEQRLRRYSRSIIIKDASSPERLLDEVTLFIHQIESALPAERQRMLRTARDRDALLDGRRILVVEDDVRNVFALTSVLEPQGAVVEIARNGLEALRALDSSAGGEQPIDLVLMDIMMPEMDGLTAMREIRKNPLWKKLPIIALTAKAMRDDQESCRAAGANDYVAKPLDVEKLLSLIRVWMPR